MASKFRKNTIPVNKHARTVLPKISALPQTYKWHINNLSNILP